MSCELLAIFDDSIVKSSKAITKYDDGNAYLAKKRQTTTKPLPPSQQAIEQFYAGKGMGKVVKTFLGRSLLIGGALAMFGENKNTNSLTRNALVASASIEAFLFYWYEIKHK